MPMLARATPALYPASDAASKAFSNELSEDLSEWVVFHVTSFELFQHLVDLIRQLISLLQPLKINETLFRCLV